MKTSHATMLATLSLALASPIAQYYELGQERPYNCNIFKLPVSVEDVPVAALPLITNQYEATSLADNATNRVQIPIPFQTTPANRTYDVLTQYCSPKGQGLGALQILSHGIGFNLSYWDFYPSANSSDDQYSYVAAATAAGHSTLSYNRLGIDGTLLPDPFSEVQSLLEVAILEQITIKARAGEIPGQSGTPTNIIHIGHSYGSLLTNALAAARPDLSDGIILTGYSHILEYNNLFIANSNFMIANLADPVAFPADKYPVGYTTWPNKWSNQFSFFAYPNFDVGVLDDAESTKQPATYGEFLTFALLGDLNAPNFTKPVLYLNGERDQIFCAGNCTGLIDEDSPAFNAFNGSSDIESALVQGFGHGMNLHLGAKDKMYSIVNDWVARKGF